MQDGAEVGVSSKGINKEGEMTPMNGVRVSIRRCSQHDQAVTLGKYFLFTPSNAFQMAENRLIRNCRGRLRGQIKGNDIKKQFSTGDFRGFDRIRRRHSLTDFIRSVFSVRWH